MLQLLCNVYMHRYSKSLVLHVYKIPHACLVTVNAKIKSIKDKLSVPIIMISKPRVKIFKGYIVQSGLSILPAWYISAINNNVKLFWY